MKKILAITAFALFALSCVLAVRGYRNYRMFQDSHGTSDHDIHLDRTGSSSIIASPPGRSVFRPGGVLEIRLNETWGELTEDFLTGSGKVRVTDHSGVVCLEQNLKDVGVGFSSRGRFIAFPREFDTSRGGPYQIEIDVSEAFTSLTAIPQTLSVHHFVCGNEVVIHLLQFVGSFFLLSTSGLLTYMLLTRKPSHPIKITVG
jgi:hypothetical protein